MTEDAPIYLSLGDSLAVGVQALPGGGRAPTDAGFADVLVAALLRRIPGLTLAKLGCDGERTATMLRGGACPYALGSQMAAVESLLAGRTRPPALMTLSIGANEIVDCGRDGAVDLACVQAGLGAIEANLPLIVERLRRATGDRTPIVAANLYNPFLGHWLRGEEGKRLARAASQLQSALNDLLARIYLAAGVRVADVAAAFESYDFDGLEELGGATAPRCVARVCRWTSMCAPPPAGPNVHPTAEGYQAIARAFESVLPESLRDVGESVT